MRLDDIAPSEGGVWYLASPYSNYEAGHGAACQHVAHVAAQLIARGVLVFSPITHSHPIGYTGLLNPKELPIWEELDLPFMEMSVGCIVAMLPGWQNSTGTANEIRWFVEQNKPIVYLEVDEWWDSEVDANAVMTSMLPKRDKKPEPWPAPPDAQADHAAKAAALAQADNPS